MTCGYWIDDGSEQGFCRYEGGMCHEEQCPVKELEPNEEDGDDEL